MRLPRFGEWCPRCHRQAPRDDGIPCRLCAPRGREGFTVTDTRGVTHGVFSWCMNGAFAQSLARGDPPINVGDVPIDCMECIAHPSTEEEQLW